tara:strand:- start:102 stop:338 length:237 start_codon:yes stop_codon:yes gene_type:complete
MIKYFIILLVTIVLVFSYVLSNRIPKKYKIYLNLAIIILFSIPIFIYLTTENLNIDKSYNPPKFDGEQIIPGYFDEKN